MKTPGPARGAGSPHPAATVEFTAGEPAESVVGPLHVSVLPSSGGDRECLVTVFAGFPPTSHVRGLCWRLEAVGGGPADGSEYRTDERGQFRTGSLREGRYVLRLRAAEEVRAEQLRHDTLAGRSEEVVRTLRAILDEAAESGGVPLEDAPPVQVVELILGKAGAAGIGERRLFLRECAAVAVLDWLADAALVSAGAAAADGEPVRLADCTLRMARTRPAAVAACAEAWEAERQQDEPAALRQLAEGMGLAGPFDGASESEAVTISLCFPSRRSRGRSAVALAATASLLFGLTALFPLAAPEGPPKSGTNPLPPVARVTVVEDIELSPANTRVERLAPGQYRVRGTFNLTVESPLGGHVAVVWSEPMRLRVYPQPDDDPLRVEAGRPTRFPFPLSLRGNSCRVVVVVTAEPAAGLLREALLANGPALVADADAVERAAEQALRQAGWPEFVLGRVDLVKGTHP